VEKDAWTTLPETKDRIVATAVKARHSPPPPVPLPSLPPRPPALAAPKPAPLPLHPHAPPSRSSLPPFLHRTRLSRDRPLPRPRGLLRGGGGGGRRTGGTRRTARPSTTATPASRPASSPSSAARPTRSGRIDSVALTGRDPTRHDPMRQAHRGQRSRGSDAAAGAQAPCLPASPRLHSEERISLMEGCPRSGSA
jgi:hypothetical protein